MFKALLVIMGILSFLSNNVDAGGEGIINLSLEIGFLESFPLQAQVVVHGGSCMSK